MRSLEPEMVDTVWAALGPLLPHDPENHPLGCRRPRAADRDCFVVIDPARDRLQLGGCRGSLRPQGLRRRGVGTTRRMGHAVVTEAISTYDKIVGLDLSEVAVDGSLHTSPGGGEGTGKNPTDRSKFGHKWSTLTDKPGIPLSWVLSLGITDAVIAKRRRLATPSRRRTSRWGYVWPVECTNSSLSNFGQLRRNTDHKLAHRVAVRRRRGVHPHRRAHRLEESLVPWQRAYPLKLLGEFYAVLRDLLGVSGVLVARRRLVAFRGALGRDPEEAW